MGLLPIEPKRTKKIFGWSLQKGSTIVDKKFSNFTLSCPQNAYPADLVPLKPLPSLLPGQSCLVGIRNIVASAFKSFISKLDATKTHITMYLDSCHRAALVALAERSSMAYSCFVNVPTQEQTTSQAPTIHPRF